MKIKQKMTNIVYGVVLHEVTGNFRYLGKSNIFEDADIRYYQDIKNHCLDGILVTEYNQHYGLFDEDAKKIAELLHLESELYHGTISGEELSYLRIRRNGGPIDHLNTLLSTGLKIYIADIE